MQSCEVCGHPSKTRCGKCLTTKYCSKECQTSDWSRHKGTCKAPRPGAKTVQVVILNGTLPTLETLQIADFGTEGWDMCPVPDLLGVPMVAKKIRPYPAKVPNEQPYVFLVIEPHSGFAPQRWMDWTNNSVVGFARTDCVPLTIDTLRDVHNLIFCLINEYAVDNPQIEKRLKPSLLTKFISQRKTEFGTGGEVISMCEARRVQDVAERVYREAKK